MFNLFGNDSRRSEHNQEVREEVREMKMAGFEDIHADIEGFPEPKERNNREPDITGKRSGNTVLKEVETEDSIGKKHSNEQREAFSEWEDEDPLNRDFSVEITDDSIF